ncbi:hypothetical protein L873DRAFT_1786938 [Choiromyces venosus 120613-1]|uniref:Chromatin assembly factor 1 subunit A n=1 Tax=Choiromyces venosus 120613-1 TaxID=1336337 RepID=A0A3N4K1W4_9PEZI|nr:hypothetical protein L873DRAFT_1786938 [Choiromyces venosus 120613-1]
MSASSATDPPVMSNPVPASTPPPLDSSQLTSANPGTPYTVKKRSISDVGSDSSKTDGGSKLVGGNGDSNAVSAATGAAGPSKKRTKLTESEREAREKEKLEKEKEKAEKEQERLAKKAERDEKKRIKDEEKRIKEEEKKKKEEEKAKKDRAQRSLMSFFTKPAAAGPASQSAPSSATSNLTHMVLRTPPPPDIITDYERSFHPFFVKPNVTVAPMPFERDDEYKTVIKNALDKALSLPRDPNFAGDPESGQSGPVGIGGGITGKLVEELMHILPHKRGRRGKLLKYCTKDILARISAPDDSSLPPLVDLKDVGPSKSSGAYLELLSSLPNKFLRFAEDVRPPYSGTYTRKPTTSGLLRGRNPFQKSLPKVDYDYDSEIEWEEEGLDGDGEELLSDEEDDEDVDSGDEDLEQFLDDENEEGVAGKNRRRGDVSAIVPICSSMCWEDSMGKNPRKEFEGMRLGTLLDRVPGPIDPFSPSYWNPEAPPQPPPAQLAANPPTKAAAITQFFQATTGNGAQSSAMPPPGPSASTAPAATTGDNLKKGKFVHLIGAHEMPAFKQAIAGSDLTKAAMIEHLKKLFPHLTKPAIKNSLDQVAQRRGQHEKDKRWVLL